MTTSLSGWSDTTIANHLCDVFAPAESNEHGYVVIYLHGVHLGRLVDKPAFSEAFQRFGLPVIAPMTARTWWTDKICPEFDMQVTAERHLLDNVMPWVEQQYGAAPPRIALLGTSMGGQGALRFALKYPDMFPIAAALSPAIDYHTRWNEGDETLPDMYENAEAARQDTATLHIHPLYWPRNIWFSCCPTDTRWMESADRLRMKLGALGIPYDCDLETRGGGHGFEYYNKMAHTAVEYIAERLDRERRRVV
jgi:pimeloyl-ACP methyl ester carboxylesterase